MSKIQQVTKIFYKKKKYYITRWLGVLFVIFLAGCASDLTKVSSPLPATFEKLGKAEGNACGTLIGGPTAYNILPIYLNERVERAYQSALSSVPGATTLMNVTMQEYWFWWAVGTTRCVTITGEAIR